jgi:hypothetical protein
VVLIDVEVAISSNTEIERTVPGHEIEHVIEEADSRLIVESSTSVEIQCQPDRGFPCVAFD